MNLVWSLLRDCLLFPGRVNRALADVEPNRQTVAARIACYLVAGLIAIGVVISTTSRALATETPHKGVAVVIGGALSHSNDEVWARLVALSGGKGATWLVFPTASGTPDASAKRIIASLEKHGATASMVPLSPFLKDVKVEDVVRDPTWITRIRAAKGIYFAGGAQERITSALYERSDEQSDARTGAAIKNTPMLDAIWSMYRDGGVVAGSSAGAAIMSADMFREPPEILTILRSGVVPRRDIDRGLGFVGNALFIDQHFLKRGRVGRLIPVMAQTGYKLGLGIEENSAAIVQNNVVEVIGAKGALLVDLREATSNRSANRDASRDANTAPNTSTGAVFQASLFAPFMVKSARLSYLDRGDKVDLGTMIVTPSTSKLSGSTLDHNAPTFKPYYNEVRFYADILGDGAIVNAMSQLLDSPKSEARGLAFGFDTLNSRGDSKRNATQSDIGFEFRLYKRADTRGYFSTALGGDDYTIINMGLDITPVRLATPFYVPLDAGKADSAEAAKAGENSRLPGAKASPAARPTPNQ